jgi:hypothetical protein
LCPRRELRTNHTLPPVLRLGRGRRRPTAEIGQPHRSMINQGRAHDHPGSTAARPRPPRLKIKLRRRANDALIVTASLKNRASARRAPSRFHAPGCGQGRSTAVRVRRPGPPGPDEGPRSVCRRGPGRHGRLRRRGVRGARGCGRGVANTEDRPGQPFRPTVHDISFVEALPEPRPLVVRQGGIGVEDGTCLTQSVRVGHPAHFCDRHGLHHDDPLLGPEHRTHRCGLCGQDEGEVCAPSAAIPASSVILGPSAASRRRGRAPSSSSAGTSSMHRR